MYFSVYQACPYGAIVYVWWIDHTCLSLAHNTKWTCWGHPVDSVCVCAYVRVCNMSLCVEVSVEERTSVYLSHCVLGSALNGAILSVFHHHLPWQRCLMTHTYTPTPTTHTDRPICAVVSGHLGPCRRGRIGNDPTFLHHVSTSDLFSPYIFLSWK